MKEFNQESDFIEHVAEQLGIANDFQYGEGLLKAFAESCAVPDQDDDDDDQLEMLAGRWVIKDDDLKLFEAVTNGTLTLAGVGFAFGSLATGGIAALFLGVIGLFRNAYRNGATLTEPQVGIVIVMKKIGEPISAADLLENLRFDRSADQWDEQALLRELTSLKKVPTKNGFKSIVECDDFGRWHLSGL